MFRGFEQLSSSRGWLVMAKHVPGTIVACAGLKVKEAKKTFSYQ